MLQLVKKFRFLVALLFAISVSVATPALAQMNLEITGVGQ